jgi:hypothetical protein
MKKAQERGSQTQGGDYESAFNVKTHEAQVPIR